MGILELFIVAVGLSMDAFAVAICKGLSLKELKLKHCLITALYFGGFQALMPFIGWICLHTIVEFFSWFEYLIPWIALILLTFIGIKMIVDGVKKNKLCEEEGICEMTRLTFGALIVQGIATSIDALSAGVNFAEYNLIEALVAVALIAIVTFIICMAGVFIGRKAGTKLEGKACILGGSILILIGITIFVKGIFF